MTNIIIPLVIISLFCIIPIISAGSELDVSIEPVYIGVLLPLTGPQGTYLYEALQYGAEQINAGGGIGGRPLRLIFRDTRSGDLRTYAEELATDPRVQVVIGPYFADELFQIADLFVNNQKVLVSPTIGSDEGFRAFSGSGSFWRLSTNSRDMTSVIMQHLISHQIKKIAILSPNNSATQTFDDWIPFWAMDTGLEITGNLKYDSQNNISDALHQLEKQDPEYILFLYTGRNQDLITAVNALHDSNSASRLYLVKPNVDETGAVQVSSDTKTLQESLVSGQWKLQDTNTISVPLPNETLIFLSPPPDPGFSKEYSDFSGKKPLFFASETYDALLVSARIMARFVANPGQSPMKAANSVLLNQTKPQTPRTILGMQAAFTMIQKGEVPVMTGATGPLTFVPEGTDRSSPWYQTYVIRDGAITVDPIVYREINKAPITSAENPGILPSHNQSENISKTGDFWAVIGGLSQDWVNYRHQADALTMYQMLRKHGVPDDHIIMMVYDDIPQDPHNTKPGEVYHVPKGEEVRKTAILDYSGEQVNQQTIEQVLTGKSSEQDLPVLGSNENSTILVYFASHGAPGGLLVIGEGEAVITPEEMNILVEKMKENQKFGQMLILLESCYSGATVEDISTSGVLVMTAAGKNETSKSAIYDPDLSSWISDEFTNKLTAIIRKSGETDSVRDLFAKIYPAVRSSHPGIYNLNNSFSPDTPISVFFGG
ncbi:MAG: C13 family peptidase [Methanobacteriota archaeon]